MGVRLVGQFDEPMLSAEKRFLYAHVGESLSFVAVIGGVYSSSTPKKDA